MNKTINSLNQLLIEGNLDSIKMLLFDIDGTLSKCQLINKIFMETLVEFNINQKKVPKLGKEILNEKWLIDKLKISKITSTKIIERYEDRYYETPHDEFKRYLYDDVESTFSELYKNGKIIGIFTLRKIEMATHQLVSAGLGKYIAKSLNFPNEKKLQISGSCINNKKRLNGLEEKLYQLKLHLKFRPEILPSEFIVVGDSLETDIKASSILNLKNVLINRI